MQTDQGQPYSKRVMDELQEATDFDLFATRAVCANIRTMQKPSHRQDAFHNLRKELKISTHAEFVGTGMKFEVRETSLQIFQEFINLYVEIYNFSRKNINAVVAVYFSLPATLAEVAQW